MRARIEIRDEWAQWPVNWTSVWVGALAALAAAIVLGLISTAAGAQTVKSIASWKTISRVDIALAIAAAFFAFVIGGWSAGKVAGFRHAEPSILHAVVAWLVALPLMAMQVAFGAGSAYGGWYGGIVTSPFVPATVAASPEAVRNTALAALTAVLLGLIGSVIGGWMASGEPMTLMHHRTRQPRYAPPKEV
jgi:hypothetical protein